MTECTDASNDMRPRWQVLWLPYNTRAGSHKFDCRSSDRLQGTVCSVTKVIRWQWCMKLWKTDGLWRGEGTGGWVLCVDVSLLSQSVVVMSLCVAYLNFFELGWTYFFKSFTSFHLLTLYEYLRPGYSPLATPRSQPPSSSVARTITLPI